MADDDGGASDFNFFDKFNKDHNKQAVTEEVNRKLCEVLTELAEELVEALAEAEAQRLPREGAESRRAGTEAEAEPGPGPGPGEEGAEPPHGGAVDEVAAMAAYHDALAAIMQEKSVSAKDLRHLPDEHPLKELFFSAFDQKMFHQLLERFIGQVRSRKQGPGEWDAEAAEGECDEDHTLE